MHGGINDLLLAQWASKGMVKEIEFDRAHGEIVAKKSFAYHSPRLESLPMPRGKINLREVLASLNGPCPSANI